MKHGKRKISVLIYRAAEEDVSANALIAEDTVWLTQKAMAQLFGVESNTITYHLKEIYDSGELEEESTARKFRVVQEEGTRQVNRDIMHYNVSDGTWLRNAALYWDEVCSIVPYRGYPDRSPELRYMEERGQYRPIYPQELFYAYNADELCSQLQKGLRQRGNSAFHSSGLQLPPRERKRIYSPGLAELIHYKKLPRNLLNTLVASGIVTPIDGEWLEADEAFEHIYMRLLAGFAAKHDQANMVIGTDKARELNSIYHAYPYTGRNGINSSVVLTLDHCFPTPAEDIGFERILDFKEEYHSELLELRRKIREYESNVSSCASIEDVKRTTAAFRESWKIELMDAE